MSEKFSCKICQREYSSPQSLCNHTRIKHKVYDSTKRGTRCYPSVHKKGNILHISPEKISPNICTYCHKDYATRHSKSRHLKICKVKQYVETQQLTENELPNTLNHSDKSIIQQKDDAAINNTVTGDNNTVNNGTINNNINVTINSFNADDTSYFSENFKNRILKYFTDNKKFHLPIPKVVQNLKFNPNHKENNNMKITNMKSDIAQKYQDNKWIYCKKSDMIDESHKIAVSMVEGWINQDQPTQETVTGFRDYLMVNKEYIRKVIFEEINKLGYIYYKNEMEPELDD